MSFEQRAFESVLGKIPKSEIMFDVDFVTARLDPSTAALASGAAALCLFARDRADAALLRVLHGHGVRLLALRYIGEPAFDARVAADFGIRVTRVPATAPASVAEYAVTLMLFLGRRVHFAANRVREGNLALQRGLVGVDMADRVVGVVGTGEVGARVASILRGFECTVLAFDTIEDARVKAAGAKYVDLDRLLAESDVLTLHVPLVPGTRNIINEHSLSQCKKGVHIVNISRAGLIDLKALVSALRSRRVGAVGMDVFEGKANPFLQDESEDGVDPDFEMLKSMPNVIVTGHQAALTENALIEVAKLTIQTLKQFQAGEDLDYEIRPDGR